MLVEVKVLENCPLMPAREVRRIAMSWENEELIKCLKTLNENILRVAAKGGRRGDFPVKCDRPEYFYTNLKLKLIELGYTVYAPSNPDKGSQKDWTIIW